MSGSTHTRRRRLGAPVAAAAAALLCAATVAACGGSDDGAAKGGTAAPGAIPKLSAEPVTLTFLWFEWPPAQALEDFANTEYKALRPNVTVKVNTVPIANWHDAIFTQFAARKTDFDIPVLDSQYIGEAVENGNILDLTDFANANIDKDAYDPYLLAAYGQYPQAKTGELDPDAKLYGLPLLGDTWAMMWRKDLMGEEPPATWEDMIAAAQKCQDENPGMSGLAFHQSKDADAAAVTYNTLNGVYGGELWNSDERKIEGVINNDAGQKAMDVLVNQMKPLTPKGSGNWFIDEVNASMAQGKVCVAFNWVATLGGQLDPKASTLGKSPEAILEKLGFAALPEQDTNYVPLGGMGMHISKYSSSENQAEALNFIKWFEQADVQKKWASAGGVPSRKDALASPEFLDAAPWNKVYADSVPRLRDFWNLPEYAKLLNVQNTNVNAALNGTKDPAQALDDIAAEQQAILDESAG
jgi:multiple sugar transport system substrate-binding protein